MLVKDIMTRDVECVREDDTLDVAARKMRDLNVGPLPVCHPDGRVSGFVTDRDITVRGTAHGLDPTRTPVSQVMTVGPVYVYEDQDARDAADAMAVHQIRRILVLDQNQHLTGIVSLADLAVDGGSEAKPNNTLREVSAPAEPRR